MGSVRGGKESHAEAQRRRASTTMLMLRGEVPLHRAANRIAKHYFAFGSCSAASIRSAVSFQTLITLTSVHLKIRWTTTRDQPRNAANTPSTTSRGSAPYL